MKSRRSLILAFLFALATAGGAALAIPPQGPLQAALRLFQVNGTTQSGVTTLNVDPSFTGTLSADKTVVSSPHHHLALGESGPSR